MSASRDPGKEEGMFLMNMNRKVAALAVAAALSLGGPLAAAGRETPAVRVSSIDFLSGGIFTRFLVWLGVTPAPERGLKSSHPGVIDPLGVLHTVVTSSTPSDRGASIDPDGHH
jgi:hypothetical protein